MKLFSLDIEREAKVVKTFNVMAKNQLEAEEKARAKAAHVSWNTKANEQFFIKNVEVFK